MAVLTNICLAPDDDPRACPEPRRRVKDSHRVTAGRMLIDRLMGMSPTPFTSDAHTEHSPGQAQVEEEPFDVEVWEGIIAELKQKEEDGILHPNPNTPKMDYSTYLSATDEEVAPYAEEEAAKFRADNALRLERRKQWPEFEEYRRKKLAQIYPSHSDDDDPPET